MGSKKSLTIRAYRSLYLIALLRVYPVINEHWNPETVVFTSQKSLYKETRTFVFKLTSLKLNLTTRTFDLVTWRAIIETPKAENKSSGSEKISLFLKIDRKRRVGINYCQYNVKLTIKLLFFYVWTPVWQDDGHRECWQRKNMLSILLVRIQVNNSIWLKNMCLSVILSSRTHQT